MAAPSTWSLADLFASRQAWDAERVAIQALTPKLRPRAVATSNELKEMLDLRYAVQLRTWRLVIYAVLSSDQDIRDTVAGEMRTAALAIQSGTEAASSWLPEAVCALGVGAVEGMIREDAGLAVYARPLRSILRRASHLLGAEAERLLALASPVLESAQQVRQTLLSSDINFPSLDLTGASIRLDAQGYERVMTNAPRADRAKAYDLYSKTIQSYERTFGTVLGAKVSGNVFAATARRHPSALDASLFENEVPREVYDTLLREVKAQLPTHQRYLEVKRRLLGVERLAIWDIPAPAISIDRRWSLAEAREATLAAVAPLGEDYKRELAANTLKPWADQLARKGKREGGYVASDAYAHPYVLLNFSGDFASLSTFAHEWGHAMHSWLSRVQPYPTFGFTTFVAEIPSKANELLLLEHLVAQARSPSEKVYYLDRLCEQYRGTLFIQSMFADFEQLIHEAAAKGQPMSGPKMSELYADLLSTYYGSSVELHPASGSLWATVIHFYLNFYVFQYATCLVAATALVGAINREGPDARTRYLDMLKAGGSKDAFTLIREAGVDLSKPEPYRLAIARFSRGIDELESAARAMGRG